MGMSCSSVNFKAVLSTGPYILRLLCLKVPSGATLGIITYAYLDPH